MEKLFGQIRKEWAPRLWRTLIEKGWDDRGFWGIDVGKIFGDVGKVRGTSEFVGAGLEELFRHGVKSGVRVELGLGRDRKIVRRAERFSGSSRKGGPFGFGWSDGGFRMGRR